MSRCMCKRLCTGGIPLLKHLLSFFVFFLSPALGLLVFLIGQTLAFYVVGKRA